MTVAVMVPAFRPKETPFESANLIAVELLEVVPAEKFTPEISPFVVTGAATDTEIPPELAVTEAFVAPVAVPAYPLASRERPELLTVQVTLDWAVFRPIASVEARAVVR